MKPLDPIGVPLHSTNLIEASAGTGKTYAITTLYLRCLLERKLAVEDLLVVTYTRAATSELRDRIRQRIHECWLAMSTGASVDTTLQALIDKSIAADSVALDLKRLALALRSFDQAGIFTIHSFCQRCLTDSAFESGASFDSEFESDDQALADEIAEDFWSREMYSIDPAQFAFLRDSKFGLSDVRTLCRKAIADPDLSIVPEPGDVPDCDLASMHALYARLRACWQGEQSAIAELLISANDSLNQQSYKPAQIAGYIEATEHFLSSERARPIADGSGVLRLGTAFLASKQKKNKVAPVHEFFDLVDAYASECQSFAAYFEALALRLKLSIFDYARSQSRQRKDQQQVLSFDDLLVRLRDALRAPGGERLARAIASRYPLALIDEFQDTDPVQYEVFRRIYAAGRENTGLFLIGDPKQAIYGFRGADLFTYFGARDDARERAHTLDTNYRSSPAMIAAVNALFSGAKDSFLFPELQFAKVSPAASAANLLVDAPSQSRAFEILVLEREGAQPSTKQRAQTLCTDRVAGEIVRLLSGDASIDGRPVVPADIAVLVRQNHQARAMQDALRSLGVPSVLESNESVFLSEDAAELERVLAAMVEPAQRNAIKSALATSLLGYSGNAVHALQEDEVAWDELLVQFQRWHATWVGRGFIQAFSQMLSDHKVGSRLLLRTDGQRKMTNLGQLGELLQERALAAGCGPQALLGWLRTMRLDPEARATVGDAAQLRLESDDAAVKIVTVHKSKGLEYNIVFCPYVWAGGLQRAADKKWVRFHDEDDAHRLKLDIGSPDKGEHMAQSSREALAEDLRLLYVALTRARHRCAIVVGVIKDFGSSGLAYLLFRDSSLQTDPESLQRFAEDLETIDDAELLGTLTSKFAAGDSGIGVRALPVQADRLLAAERGDSSSDLRARPHTRLLTRPWRSASFSSLSRNADAERDHDAHSNDAPALEQPISDGEPVILANFPRGAHPGQMLHHVFEHLDFWQAQPAKIDAQVRESLLAFGFESERHAELVSRAVARVLSTPLAEADFCLADVPTAQRLDELEFQFPVCEDGPGFSPATLASALTERSAPPWPPRYLESLKNLGFAPLHGFLKGFIDMVFVHEERWYLVDYKSNFLGPYSSDYQRPAMLQSMAEHHYFLQYHIYMVALDRYLRLRLPDYDYETHIGGVYYLFLRGMDADHPGQAGIFFDRPNADDIARLDAALGPREAGKEC